jgi:hypothetical protein
MLFLEKAKKEHIKQVWGFELSNPPEKASRNIRRKKCEFHSSNNLDYFPRMNSS